MDRWKVGNESKSHERSKIRLKTNPREKKEQPGEN